MMKQEKKAEKAPILLTEPSRITLQVATMGTLSVR
jgi:hypothetical protein